MVVVKASLFWLVGFFAFTLAWGWYYLRPTSSRAVGANLVRALVTANPLYWSLALTAAFGCTSLYLFARWVR
jgi:hypothetical protein